ncbi:MAG: hypothetical protein NWS53_01000 [Salibacteraceae bacterium]|nr:hypothetical protein [Salibacteraceae bacterium]
MKHLFSITLFVFVSFMGVSSIVPPKIDTHDIHVQIKKLMRDDRSLRFDEGFFRSFVFLNDSVAYYNPNGTLHLFQINFDSTAHVTLLRDATYNGHNFNRNLFIHDQNLYSFGGSGLFNSNIQLIKFNFQIKEWYLTEIKELPINVSHVINSWLDENELHVLYRLNEAEPTYSYGIINMIDLTFREVSRLRNTHSHNLNFGDLSMIFKSEHFNIISFTTEKACHYRLFNTKTGDFIGTSFYQNLPCVDGFSMVYTQDSMLFYRDESGLVDSLHLNKTTLYSASNFIDAYTSEQKSESSTLRLVMFFLGLACLGGIIFYMKRQNKSKTQQADPFDSTILRFIEERGKTVSRDELDILLGINHLSSDTIKSNRSVMIKKINEDGRVTIERTRNEKDKRFYDYSIQ